MRFVDPGCYGTPGLFSYLKLNRAMGLLLHERSSRQDTGTQRNIPDMQLHQITAAEFAINRKVEQREVSDSMSKLQSNPDSPNFLQFQRF